MKTAKEYRAMARGQLQNNIFSNVWLLALVVCLIEGLLVSACSYVAFVGAFLIEGIIALGCACIFLKLARGATSIDFNDLLACKTDVGRALLLGLMKNLFLFLWCLLFVIPGIVKNYSYACAYYLASDHPEYDWKTCISESRRIMNGHKWQLFCLDISFLGWYIVGCLCLGVGMLWVTPYHESARANFYEDLIKENGNIVY